jgi:hypothetical protein
LTAIANPTHRFLCIITLLERSTFLPNHGPKIRFGKIVAAIALETKEDENPNFKKTTETNKI